MACPICPAAGWVGGWFGGYLGIHPPEHSGGRILSAVVTANLISITVIALKAIFNISLCQGGGFTLENFIRVGIKALIMGIIYSIGVNYLLNRYVFPHLPAKAEESLSVISDSLANEEVEEPLSCCCQDKKEK